MTITLRQNKGAPLTIAELDGNFTDLDGRLEVVEAGQTSVKSIDEIVQVGNSLIVQYNDTSTDGPFTFEVLIQYRGDWAAETSYAVNDLVRANGVIYLVPTAHVSATTFDAGANNGSASDYYIPFLSMPELSIPVGGGERYVLAKNSATDNDVAWFDIGLPTGGQTGDLLVRTGTADGDWAWGSSSELTPSVVNVTATTLFLNSASYANTYFRCTNSSGCTVTVGIDTDLGVDVGTEIHFRQCSSNQVIILAGSDSNTSVLLNLPPGYEPATAQEGAILTIKKVAANEWDMFGWPTAGSAA